MKRLLLPVLLGFALCGATGAEQLSVVAPVVTLDGTQTLTNKTLTSPTTTDATLSATTTVAAGSSVCWNGRTCLSSGSDGVLSIKNNAGTDFSLLRVGGSTSSFPAWKRSGATWAARLGDDSGDTGISASTGAYSGAITLTDTGAGASANPTVTLDRNSASPAAADVAGSVEFLIRDSANNSTAAAKIQAIIDDPVDATEDTHLQAITLAAGASLTGTLPNMVSGTATFDPPSLADAAGSTTTVTVTGAALGDIAVGSFSLTLSGITVTYYISAANTCSVRFQNESAGLLDLGSGTLKCAVLK